MAAAPKVQSSRQHAPRVNTFDIPELLPGARPGANPAQREEFEERCRLLHRESEAEREAERAERLEASEAEAEAAAVAASVAAPAVTDIEAMFPCLDGELVRAIYREARDHQEAIDTLLTLSADAADAGADAAALPPLDLGVEDHDKFPSLVDAGGWQVATERQFNRDPENEDLGSAWRDRAKAAQDLPAPRPTATSGAATSAPRRRASAKENKAVDEPVQFETDYEFRHRRGQRRSQNKSLYGGRGSRRKAGNAKAPESDDDGASTDSELVVGGGGVLEAAQDAAAGSAAVAAAADVAEEEDEYADGA